MRDADGAEEDGVARVLGEEGEDAAPKEEEGGESALVFRADEGAAELDGGAGEVAEETFVEAEEGARIEGGEAGGLGDDVGKGEAIAADDFAFVALPEDDLVVGVVEVVGVEVAAGAFAGGAEGDFAEAADFAEGDGDVSPLGGVDVVGVDGAEVGLGGKGTELGGEVVRGNGRDDGDVFAGGVVKGQSAHLALEARGVDAAGEEEGAEAEVAEGVNVFREAAEEGLARERGADAEGEGAAAQAEHLARQQDGAQTGMDFAHQVEEERGRAGDVDREEALDVGAAGQSHERGLPGGVADAEGMRGETGDLAGGEDDEDLAVAEPVEGLAEGVDVARHGTAAAEGVDEEEVVAQLRDATEDIVGHDLHVAPAAADELQQGEALHCAEGVVGHDQETAFGGDALKVLG